MNFNVIQSAWEPVSRMAWELKDLTVFLTLICSLVFVAVIMLLAMSVSRSSRQKTPKFEERFVLWSGILVPSIILLGVFLYSLRSTMALERVKKNSQNALTVKVTGYQWWWEVEYPELGIVSANEIHLPTGRPIKFQLKSKDVIHSFWVPNVHGKLDMLPDHQTELFVQLDHPGVYRGQCAEFCGLQHALMAIDFIVHTPEEFKKWTETRLENLSRVEKIQGRGKEVFFEQSCQTCHAITGTRAQGKTGPNLTHLSTRLSLGAGTISNNPKNLREWILRSREIKPANRMPNYDINEEDLTELVNYLSELK